MTDATEVPRLDDDLFLVTVEDRDGGTEHQTLSHSRSTLVLLGMATNKYVRATSKIFKTRYGLGVMDWRMLVTLTRHPGTTVTKSSRMIGIDKGAVSRALSRLEEKGLAVATTTGAGERRKNWVLTEKGVALHAELLTLSLGFHHAILKGLSETDIETLNGYLHHLLANIEELNGTAV